MAVPAERRLERPDLPVWQRTVSGFDGADEGYSLEDILAMIRRRIRLIAAFAVVGTAIATAIGTLVAPTYSASSAVAVDVSPPRFADVTTEDHSQPRGGVDTKIALLNSRPLQLEVMDKLHLWADPLFNPAPFYVKLLRPVATLVSMLPASVRSKIRLDPLTSSTANVTPRKDYPEQLHVDDSNSTSEGQAAGDRQSDQAREAAYERFRQHLLITRTSGDSEVINISVTLSNSQTAASIANGLADEYVKWELEHRQQAAAVAVTWLKPRLADLQRAVESAETTAAVFRTKHGLSATSAEGGTLNDQRLEDLGKELISVQADEMQLKTKIARVRAARDNPDQIASVLESPLIGQLLAQRASLEYQRAQLAQDFGRRHPRMLNSQAQIDQLDQHIRAEVDHAIGSMRDDLSMAVSRSQALQSALDGLQGGNQQDRRAEVELRELERQAKAARDQYEDYLGRYQAAHQDVEITHSNARVVSRAAPPAIPTTPGLVIVGLVGFVGSLFLGGVASFFCERMDGGVHNARQLERALGIPNLGILPKIRSRRLRRYPASYVSREPLTFFAEAAQAIATHLRVPFGEKGDVILVTSSLPNEGKTTLVVSIAAAVVQVGGRCVVVDLDLRNPSVPRRLEEGKGSQLGLVEFLRGRASREEITRHDEVSGIDFIAAGKINGNPHLLLQHPGLAGLLRSLRSDYDQIVLDSSPALAVSEASVTSQFADRIIVATRWRTTDIRAVSETLRRLLVNESGKRTGFVLTQVDAGKYRLYAKGEAYSYFRQYRKYYTG